MTPLRIISFALFVFTLSLLPAQAQAQNNFIPDTFVPWLRDQGFSIRQQNGDINKQGRAGPQKQTKSRRDTDRPALTPEDTELIIKKLQESRLLPPPSALERYYSRRFAEELTQFGYDLFETGDSEKETEKRSRPEMPAGAVQDDFILGSGDKLAVLFRGQREDEKIYTVNNDGQLIIKGLAPVSAAGKTVAQLREELRARVSNLHNTEVFVSLDSVRQIDVLVVGHVKKPGRHNLTVFHSALDALLEAGGIEKTGSLRQIKLVRNGRSAIIDLYGLLVHGSNTVDMRLRDGDRLIVPPIGPTVAVAGGVKRPGIFELRKTAARDAEKKTLQEMLGLSGGLVNPGENRFLKLDVTRDGQETVTEISALHKPLFGNGSILNVAPSKEKRAGTVMLTGHTRQAGLHDLDKSTTLATLLDDEKVFGPDIYPLIGVIERWNEDQMVTQMLSFPPLLVIKDQFDRKLNDGDVVHLFSRAQIDELQEKDDNDPEAGAENGIIPVGSAPHANDEIIEDPAMISFLKEHNVFVRGAVRREGKFPAAAGTSLENLIAVAGGLALEANTHNIEVTSSLLGEGHQKHGRSGTQRKRFDLAKTDPAAIVLEPGDAVRVNQRFHKNKEESVLIMGEVMHPGHYDLLPGDKLSDLFRRAGGLTKQAYPEGAIFSRESARKAEEARFRAAARDLQRAIAAAADKEGEAPDTGQIALARDLAAELRQIEAVGRITVEADPSVLSVQPELDILLEKGDKIFVPRRPLTVKVSGEVLSPAALQFREGKDARDYIDEAGGFTFHADKRRVFVLYPDGSAEPLHVNAWNHKSVFIPPGSTVVVPRDPEPLTFIQTARDMSQILSNLAITGIFLDDLQDD